LKIYVDGQQVEQVSQLWFR